MRSYSMISCIVVLLMSWCGVVHGESWQRGVKAYWRFEKNLAGDGIHQFDDSMKNGTGLWGSAWPGESTDVPFSGVVSNNGYATAHSLFVDDDLHLMTNTEAHINGGRLVKVDIETLSFRQFTVEASYKPDFTNYSNSGWRSVIACQVWNKYEAGHAVRDGSFVNEVFRILCKSDGSIELRVVGPDDTYVISTPAGYMPTNAGSEQWYNMVAVGDGKTVKFVINGELIGTAMIDPAHKLNFRIANDIANNDTIARWAVGSSRHWNSSSQGLFARGKIDEVRLSNIALDESAWLQNDMPTIENMVWEQVYGHEKEDDGDPATGADDNPGPFRHITSWAGQLWGMTVEQHDEDGNGVDENYLVLYWSVDEGDTWTQLQKRGETETHEYKDPMFFYGDVKDSSGNIEQQLLIAYLKRYSGASTGPWFMHVEEYLKIPENAASTSSAVIGYSDSPYLHALSDGTLQLYYVFEPNWSPHNNRTSGRQDRYVVMRHLTFDSVAGVALGDTNHQSVWVSDLSNYMTNGRQDGMPSVVTLKEGSSGNDELLVVMDGVDELESTTEQPHNIVHGVRVSNGGKLQADWDSGVRSVLYESTKHGYHGRKFNAYSPYAVMPMSNLYNNSLMDGDGEDRVWVAFSTDEDFEEHSADSPFTPEVFRRSSVKLIEVNTENGGLSVQSGGPAVLYTGDESDDVGDVHHYGIGLLRIADNEVYGVLDFFNGDVKGFKLRVNDE
ncbi:hypothetical protein KS4_00420 [Poriferisphaera corsica]|uniref:Uncharacterized protein n=1 Tax=Poriferisphaera corsica TaxID=2528020 RepID=A0A517YP65_9BACT|nr:LamG domain-containing protein [Poriferisphaera corsica]QDU32014.1 hypothetical protein KS4_00420 [Poriferisphaera corsica]